jgi:hypothetical protein
MGWFSKTEERTKEDAEERAAFRAKVGKLNYVKKHLHLQDGELSKLFNNETLLDETVRQCEEQQDTEKLRELAREYVSNVSIELLERLATNMSAVKLVNLSIKTRLFNVVIAENSSAEPKLQLCNAYTVNDRGADHRINVEIVVGRNWDRCVFDLTV